MERADVVIVGAGLTGLSAGYWMAKAGAKVIVLDKGRVAWEASSRATGYLSLRAHEPRESPLAAVAEQMWSTLSEELGYPTEWTPAGRMWAAFNDEQYEELKETFESFKQSNIPFRLLDGDEAREIMPALSPQVHGAIHTHHSGHGNPQRTAQAFAWALNDRGGQIRELTPVLAIETNGGKVVGVKSPHGRIATDIVVNAAGPQAGLVGRLVDVDIPVAAARFEAMITAPIPPLFDIALVGHGLSVRQTKRGNIHFNGGPYEWVGVELAKEPAKPNTPLVRNIARRLGEIMPGLQGAHVLRCWSGVVDATPDEMCIVDRLSSPEGFVVAVTSGHGFGMAPSVGLAVSELALNGVTQVPVSQIGLDRFARLDPDWISKMRRDPGQYNT
jgi:sarcosine oxidase subunit beta